ncbi:MAG: KTSC domain-containing protein [Flavobacteriaceae bacterium]|nr:KTSC domain-containing protein [Flavobacteriaceae bacterium]
MERQAVRSSNLASIGYDPSSQILEVEFHGGRLYEFYDVPASEYRALMNASSHGKYFNANIKNNYNFKEL